MQHFFADRSWVQGDKIRLEGSDVNHMKNVLRMKEGEEVQVSDGTGNAYLCQIEGYVRTVASLLGHAQASTTLDIYAHAFDKNKRKAQEKLGKAIGL